jgi:PAS domain S-box-containing protein
MARIARGEIDRFSAEVRFVHLAGNVLHGTLRAHSRFDAGGGANGIAGTISEVDRRRREDEGQTSRRYLNTLLANVPGMIYRGLNDRDWTMEFVSDGCLDLTGYEPWEIVGNQRVAFGSLIHPEDREFVWSQVQAAVAARRAYQIAYRLVHASGRTLRVWEQGRGMFSAQGELLSIEGFITDLDIRSSTEERTRNRVWFDALHRHGEPLRVHPTAGLDAAPVPHPQPPLRRTLGRCRCAGTEEDRLLQRSRREPARHRGAPLPLGERPRHPGHLHGGLAVRRCCSRISAPTAADAR